MFESDRLLLRDWTEADLPFVDHILGDPIVMEFSDKGALTKQEQRTWLQEAAKPRIATEPPGVLAIVQKKNRKVLGYVSLVRDLSRVCSNDAEIGFRLARTAWGQGYATEAASVMLKAVVQSPSVERVIAIVDPNNHRSVRVLKRIGMIHQGEITFKGYDYPDHVYTWQSS